MNRLPPGGDCVTRTSAVIDGYGRVKCDPQAAVRLAREYGGTVETATATIYPDGSELLGAWRITPPEVIG